MKSDEVSERCDMARIMKSPIWNSGWHEKLPIYTNWEVSLCMNDKIYYLRKPPGFYESPGVLSFAGGCSGSDRRGRGWEIRCCIRGRIWSGGLKVSASFQSGSKRIEANAIRSHVKRMGEGGLQLSRPDRPARSSADLHNARVGAPDGEMHRRLDATTSLWTP